MLLDKMTFVSLLQEVYVVKLVDCDRTLQEELQLLGVNVEAVLDSDPGFLASEEESASIRIVADVIWDRQVACRAASTRLVFSYSVASHLLGSSEGVVWNKHDLRSMTCSNKRIGILAFGREDVVLFVKNYVLAHNGECVEMGGNLNSVHKVVVVGVPRNTQELITLLQFKANCHEKMISDSSLLNHNWLDMDILVMQSLPLENLVFELVVDVAASPAVAQRIKNFGGVSTSKPYEKPLPGSIALVNADSLRKPSSRLLSLFCMDVLVLKLEWIMSSVAATLFSTITGFVVRFPDWEFPATKGHLSQTFVFVHSDVPEKESVLQKVKLLHGYESRSLESASLLVGPSLLFEHSNVTTLTTHCLDQLLHGKHLCEFFHFTLLVDPKFKNILAGERFTVCLPGPAASFISDCVAGLGGTIISHSDSADAMLPTVLTDGVFNLHTVKSFQSSGHEVLKYTYILSFATGKVEKEDHMFYESMQYRPRIGSVHPYFGKEVFHQSLQPGCAELLETTAPNTINFSRLQFLCVGQWPARVTGVEYILKRLKKHMGIRIHDRVLHPDLEDGRLGPGTGLSQLLPPSNDNLAVGIYVSSSGTPITESLLQLVKLVSDEVRKFGFSSIVARDNSNGALVVLGRRAKDEPIVPLFEAHEHMSIHQQAYIAFHLKRQFLSGLGGVLPWKAVVPTALVLCTEERCVCSDKRSLKQNIDPDIVLHFLHTGEATTSLLETGTPLLVAAVRKGFLVQSRLRPLTTEQLESLRSESLKHLLRASNRRLHCEKNLFSLRCSSCQTGRIEHKMNVIGETCACDNKSHVDVFVSV